jgi:hypothetical protein
MCRLLSKSLVDRWSLAESWRNGWTVAFVGQESANAMAVSRFYFRCGSSSRRREEEADRAELGRLDAGRSENRTGWAGLLMSSSSGLEREADRAALGRLDG